MTHLCVYFSFLTDIDFRLSFSFHLTSPFQLISSVAIYYISMSSEWSRFVSGLEAKGVSFERIQNCNDPTSVIRSLGITDPIQLAVIETEWKRRLGDTQQQPRGRDISSPQQAAPLSTAVLNRYQDNISIAPEEIQDTIMAQEAIGALCGRAGSFFLKVRNEIRLSDTVPPSLRVAQAVIPIANAYMGLTAECLMEGEGKSSVAMALGEVINEICCAYINEVGKVDKWCKGKSMPLMRVLADAQRIGYPITRLHGILQEIQRRRDGNHGARLLHALHIQLTQASGSDEDQHLISLVLRRAAIPYLSILKVWMREGLLKDPFGEFFVTEDRSAADAEDPGAAFHHRFKFVKELVPGFINKDRMARLAFVAGQYCCLLRECTGSLPSIAAYTEHEPLVWTDADDLQAIVQKYYDSACGAVIALLFNADNDLLGKLNSLKKYFLHSKGDWLVDFFENADEALQKSPSHVKIHSLRVMLQSAIAKSSGTSDPYHGAISCSFSEHTLDKHIFNLNNQEYDDQDEHEGGAKLSNVRAETRRCIELLQLDVHYQWPLTLVITPLIVGHFNCIFRLLSWIKAAERSLHAGWRQRGDMLPIAMSLKQQMLQFLRQFQFYASHFVLDRLWGTMTEKLAKADSVYSISQTIHQFFITANQELALSSSQRFGSLCKILDLTHQFSLLGAQQHLARPSQLRDNVHRVGESFWNGLAELATPRGSDYPHLLPLLTWIDFSRFYEERNIYRVMHSASAHEQAESLLQKHGDGGNAEAEYQSEEASAEVEEAPFDEEEEYLEGSDEQ